MSTPSYAYSGVVISLHVIAEFLNTIDERTFRRHGERHVADERLTSPEALSTWLTRHGLAGGETMLSEADVAATVDLRTALRHTLDHTTATPAVFDDYPLRLVQRGSGDLRLASCSGRPWLDVLVEAVAQSVARKDWARIKLCAASDCRWAFFDTSRSGRGRWCSMEACGNRHKTRAYRERRQRAE